MIFRVRLTSRTFAFIGALLVSLGLLACGSDDAPATPPALPAVATVLDGAATRMQQVRSMHFVFDHDHGSTQIVRQIAMTRAEGDVVAPDKMQATLDGALGPVNFKTGMVLIGPDAWLQNPLNHRWESDSITIDQVFDPQAGVVSIMRTAQGAALVGIEEVDGAKCYRVEVTLDSGTLALLPGDPQAGHPVLTVAWIGVTDQLVRRIELRGPVASGERDDIVRRLTLSAFDQDVAIVPPR
jgi:hypothetical protein